MEKNSLPIAYAMKKKSVHMCHGGDCAHPSHKMADGGGIQMTPEERKAANTGEAPTDYGPNEQYHEMNGKNIPDWALTHEWYGDRADSPAPQPAPSKKMADGGQMKSKRERAMAAFHKMADGGLIDDAIKVAPLLMAAEGGFIGSRQSLDKPEVDGELMPKAHLELEKRNEFISHPDRHDSHVEHDVMNQEGAKDEGAGDMDSIHPMVMRIMMGRAKGYSEGGQVANKNQGESADEPDQMAKDKDNEFDDLALRDGLASSYTGSNSGDELDDAEQNHEREDIVSRIMKSRSKKDRMAIPGEGSTYGKGK